MSGHERPDTFKYKTHTMKTPLILSASLLLLTACGQGGGKAGNNSDTTAVMTNGVTHVAQTAQDAYTFGLPLVLMSISHRQMTDADNPQGAPVNTFVHRSAFPDASFKAVVRPNADTYYSMACLDLKAEPIVLSLPNTHGRYYMMPLLDAYTNVFASPGKRTTGTEAANYLITGPGWQGSLPQGMKELKSPTNLAFAIGRIQVNSKADGDKVVVPLQQQLKLVPLSAWGKDYTAPQRTHDASLSMESPNDVVQKMSVSDFFNYLNHLLAEQPPYPADKPMLDKLAAIGVGPGLSFDLTKFSTDEQAALNNTPKNFFDNIKTGAEKAIADANHPGATSKAGAFGTGYHLRTMIAFHGLFANLPEDAMYVGIPSDENSQALSGTNHYTLHFDKGQTPPVKAFWSLTLYNNEGFMVANPINRNAIGDRSNMKANPDGSLDIYIQHNSPGKGKESNWLPAPEGPFNLLLRMYWPQPALLDGSWKMPPVKKQQAKA